MADFRSHYSKLNNQRGLTIAEMTVVIAIFLMMAGGMMSMILAAQGIWAENKMKIDLNQNLRKAMSDITDDLRQTGSSAISSPATGNSASSITFQKPSTVSGGTIVWNSYTTAFSLSGTQLIKLENSASTVVATDISSLLFTLPSGVSDAVTIDITAQGTSTEGRVSPVPLSLRATVQLRN